MHTVPRYMFMNFLARKKSCGRTDSLSLLRNPILIRGHGNEWRDFKMTVTQSMSQSMQSYWLNCFSLVSDYHSTLLLSNVDGRRSTAGRIENLTDLEKVIQYPHLDRMRAELAAPPSCLSRLVLAYTRLGENTAAIARMQTRQRWVTTRAGSISMSTSSSATHAEWPPLFEYVRASIHDSRNKFRAQLAIECWCQCSTANKK